MRISIIVPSFNQGAFIRQTIDSILTQDHSDYEVLVLDGASKDDTVDILRSYDTPALRWWSEPDRGVVDAVNKGLSRVTGEIIAVQSSDDLYVPGALTAVAREFEAEPMLDLVYGDVEYIDARSHMTGRTYLPPFILEEYLAKLSYIPQPAAVFTAAAARRAGPWREDISYAADAEFYLRLVLRGKARKIDRVLALYRYHDAQRDKHGRRIARDWAAAVEPLAAEPRYRRHVRSGIWRVRHHYTPERQWVKRTWYTYRMLLANPAMLRRMDWRDLVPGRYPLWRILSLIKRALGFKPRGT